MEVESPMVMWIVRPSICPHHTLNRFAKSSLQLRVLGPMGWGISMNSGVTYSGGPPFALNLRRAISTASCRRF